MSEITKARAERCVTHHAGCDCREYRLQQAEARIRELEARQVRALKLLDSIATSGLITPEACEDFARKAIEALTAPPDSEPNQCDGCRRDLPIVNGMHVDHNGMPIMVCTSGRYESNPAPTPDDGEGALADDPLVDDLHDVLNELKAFADQGAERTADPVGARSRIGWLSRTIRRSLREPRVPDGETIEIIRDAICLLEQSAGPFDEACRILRAVDPQPQEGVYQSAEQGRAKTAWHPVSDPPKYDLIDGKIHPWVLWQEDSETTCPQRVGADEIGGRYTAGWWGWPYEVLATAPQPQKGESDD